MNYDILIFPASVLLQDQNTHNHEIIVFMNISAVVD